MKQVLLVLLCVFTGNLLMAQGPPNQWLIDSLGSQVVNLATAVSCNEQKMVLPKTFNKLTSGVLTKVAPNIAGDIKQGTGANIKFSDDKTSAEIQSTFRLSNAWLLNFGFNGAITNNITEIYSGKNGLGTDWGGKLGISWAFKRGLFYKSRSLCEEFHLKRTNYLMSLYNQALPLLDTNRTALSKAITDNSGNIKPLTLTNSFTSSSIAQDTVARNNLVRDIETLNKRKSLFKTASTNADIAEALYNYLEDSLVAYEERAARWTGYNVWLLNAGILYNSKEFTQFNPSVPLYSNRFMDTAYHNYGLSIGVAWYRSTPKTGHNFSLDLTWKNQANFELPENKKYNKTYVTDSLISTSIPSVQQQSTASKKAFDSSYVSFKTFHSFNVDLQYTLLLGENKNFGLNAAVNWSNSKFYSVSNRVDILFGPMLSLANTEKDGSKLNFGLMAGFKNIFDNNLSTKDKFNIAFNVNIPFKVISF